MIEILNIILQLVFVSFSFIILSPNQFVFFNRKIELSFEDNCIFSFVFFFNILFLMSITNLSKNLIILIFLIFFVIFIFNKQHLKIFENKKFMILIFSIITFSISLDLVANSSFGWDSQKFWLPKASYFFNDYHFNEIMDHRKEYPFLFSYVWGLFWKLSFFQYEYFGRIAFVSIYTFCIFYFVNKFNLNSFAKTIVALCIIILTYNLSYFDGRQDIILFSLNLLVAALFKEIFFSFKKNLFHFYLLPFVFNLILWCKTEGIVYFLIFSFIILYFSKYNKLHKIFFTCLCVFFIILKFSLYYFNEITLTPHEEAYSNFEFQFVNMLENFYYTIKWSILYLFRNLYLLLILVIIFLDRKSLLNKSNLNIILASILIYLAIVAGFTVTTYPMPFHVIGGLDRVLFQFSGFLSIFLIVSKKINKLFI